MENKRCGVLSNMAGFFIFTLFFLVGFSTVLARNSYSPAADEDNESSLRNYIVHVRQPKATAFAESQDSENWHRSFLPVRSTASSEEEERMLYSYKHAISGFAARLTAEEMKAMEEKDGFILAHLERKLPLQTTHSPQFLGLDQEFSLWSESTLGNGVIIGLLDTGILPSHPSFSDEGMPPPPAKWKGRCEFNISDCNNKLIGARSFNSGAKAGQGAAAKAPTDEEGHGTHTASTAAGGFVKGANVLGQAVGTAAGMAPKAHLSMYKVCFGENCAETDILAGLDAAVEDGVDVLSISLGGDPLPFYQDTVAIGSFGAIQKGIFVSCAAGNSGPFNSTLSNDAPWILTVGASTIDRSIKAIARLGDGQEFDGESLFLPHEFPSKFAPVVYAGVNGKEESKFCPKGSLKDMNVKGKVVLCVVGGSPRIAKGAEVKSAGGVAMILMNSEEHGFSTTVDAHVLPAIRVSFSAGSKIKDYIISTSSPMATIVFKGTVIGGSSSPAVASFSSRGPSVFSPGILKPDIIGPGVSILAAWPFPLRNNTNSKSTFNIISGTSMSCPHLSGIATLLKSSHPDWSPAAIKSSIMTTADLLNHEGKPIIDETLRPADIFATGAGHVNPSRANDPGLVYDIQPDDYIPYLCGLNYTDAQVGILAHRKVRCSNESRIPEGQLNYPSFSVTLGPTQTFTRRVTNVGEANSSYTVEILAPKGVAVSVKPEKLSFTKVKQTMTYSVTFSHARLSAPTEVQSSLAQGYLKWVSAEHFVRSPISVTFR